LLLPFFIVVPTRIGNLVTKSVPFLELHVITATIIDHAFIVRATKYTYT